MSDLLTGQCEHCSGEFEFAAGDAGAVAQCPLCGREIVLRAAGEETALAADTTPAAPGKSRRWIAVAGIAVAVLALAGTAAAFYIKRNHGGDTGGGGADKGGSVSSEASGAKPPSKPAAKTNPLADLDSDGGRDVTPVIAPYQGGLSAAQIQRGREVFWDKCTECHRLFDPSVYAPDHWAKTMGSMRGKAKLNGAQAEQLDIFIRSLRER